MLYRYTHGDRWWQMETDEIYKDIAEDVKNGFDTSNYELDRPFPKWKIKK